MAAFTSRAFVLSVVLSLLFPWTKAKDFLVRDSVDGWHVAADPDDLNERAEQESFYGGDYLVFNFSVGASALEVKLEDYQSCRSTSYPLARYEGVNNRALLYRNGSFFFISGSEESCEEGKRIHVEVRPSQAHVASLYSSSSRAFPTDPAGLLVLSLAALLLLSLLGM